MSAAGSLAAHRAELSRELRRLLDGLGFSYVALLRDQFDGSESPDDGPALLCLVAAETFGGEAERALPAATSLALVGGMASIFLTIAEQPGADNAGDLIETWGMPRSLNGADACFALAQRILLSSDLADETMLVALELLDGANRRLSEQLHVLYESAGSAAGPRALAALVPAAVALGALLGGSDAALVRRIAALPAIDAELLRQAGVPDSVGASLLAALAEVMP
jgi:hypothetical protein